MVNNGSFEYQRVPSVWLHNVINGHISCDTPNVIECLIRYINYLKIQIHFRLSSFHVNNFRNCAKMKKGIELKHPLLKARFII